MTVIKFPDLLKEREKSQGDRQHLLIRVISDLEASIKSIQENHQKAIRDGYEISEENKTYLADCERDLELLQKK